MGKFTFIFTLASICLLFHLLDARLTASQVQNLVKAGQVIGTSVYNLIHSSAFNCGTLCWQNDWAKRDRVSHRLGMYDWRCSYGYFWGGRCYCVGPAQCGCGHQCYKNDWQRRDREAHAHHAYHQRCSFDDMAGGRCYCWGRMDACH